MEYGMNKGVGRSVEFRGLTSQYLFLFAAGMLGPHGLMKRLAARRHPRRIIHRRSIRHLIVKRN